MQRRGCDNADATGHFSVPYSGPLSMDAERAGSRLREKEALTMNVAFSCACSFTFLSLLLRFYRIHSWCAGATARKKLENAAVV